MNQEGSRQPIRVDEARRRHRQWFDRLFVVLCKIIASASVLVLVVLLVSIIALGWRYLSVEFVTTNVPSREAELSGIMPMFWGSLWACGICALVGVPLGVGTAILLEEFKPRSRILRRIHGFVQLNITNLAGVPSIVYGLLGLTMFANMFGLFGENLSEPSFRIGEKWYDNYFDAAGRIVLVPVDGREAEQSSLEQAGKVYDYQLQQKAIQLVSREELAEPIAAFDLKLDAFKEDAKSRILDLKQVTPEAVRAILAEVVASLEWKVDRDSWIEQLTAEISAIEGLGESRSARRDLDRSLRGLIEAERTEHFAGYVYRDAESTRVSRKSWYYLQLPFGRSVLAGGLTLMLVVLPVVIISSQEALRAVPNTLRQGALALGCTRWQMIRTMTLPAAIPGIMTGTILAVSRAMGEAAPILVLSGIVYITFAPANVMDDFTVMPLQIYEWAKKPGQEFQHVAAAGIIVLLTLLLSFNALAIFIRYKFQRPLS